MKRGTLLIANELSNEIYGFTNQNHNCTAKFLSHHDSREDLILVLILTCEKGYDFVGSKIYLKRNCFDVFKERPKHFISKNIIEKNYENRR